MRMRRYGICALFAGGVTLGLGLMMQSVVAVEFVPQPTDRIGSPTAAYVYEQAVSHDHIEKYWDWAQAVEPPPAIPRLPIIEVPIYEVISEQKEWLEVRFDPKQPLVRIPPVIPTRFLSGDVSGYCRVRFDISPNGKPYNMVAIICTNSQLERPSIRAVQKWKYAPKIQNGRAVKRSGMETTVRFNLKDERGNLLPVPKGF